MKNIIIAFSMVGLMVANTINYENATSAQKAMMEIVWQKAMEAKKIYKQSLLREEIIDNLASTAPREDFIINLDVLMYLIDCAEFQSLHNQGGF